MSLASNRMGSFGGERGRRRIKTEEEKREGKEAARPERRRNGVTRSPNSKEKERRESPKRQRRRKKAKAKATTNIYFLRL